MGGGGGAYEGDGPKYAARADCGRLARLFRPPLCGRSSYCNPGGCGGGRGDWSTGAGLWRAESMALSDGLSMLAGCFGRGGGARAAAGGGAVAVAAGPVFSDST